MQIIVFQTDSDGLFLYETVANELALAPGFFNIPYGAVEERPPAAPAGKVARWMDSEWSLVEDFRLVPLFLIDSVLPYTIGTTVELSGELVMYPGWGPLPAWLTDPSSEHPQLA